VIDHGVTGFLVANVTDAVAALAAVPAIDPQACRLRVQERFSIGTMVQAYEGVYAKIFEHPAGS
jgi:hypothetical protein